MKPISPHSDLGRNIAALLADAPDGRITAAQFKAAYTKRFKLELDLKGGKLPRASLNDARLEAAAA